MGGDSQEVLGVVGRDGRRYFTTSEAARRLGTSPDTVRREFSLRLAKDLVPATGGKGRPHTHVVDAEEVEAKRREVLEKLGVEERIPAATNDSEVRALRRRVSELASAYDELVEQYEALADVSDAKDSELARLRRHYREAIRSIAAGPRT